MSHECNLSVIVPVYNVSDYLERCLDSILNQSLSGIEILVVDDGSTDGSAKIVETYRSRFGEVVALKTRQNGGAGVARNLALEYVRGKYVGFVDPDDYVGEGYFEGLYNAAVHLGADIVMTQNVVKFLDGDIEVAERPAEYVCESGQNIVDQPNELLKMTMCWNKIYRTELLTRNNIRFADNSYIEEMPFLVSAFVSACSVYVVESDVYYYRVGRPGASTAHNRHLCDIWPMIGNVRAAYDFIESETVCGIKRQLWAHALKDRIIIDIRNGFDRIKVNQRSIYLKKVQAELGHVGLERHFRRKATRSRYALLWSIFRSWADGFFRPARNRARIDMYARIEEMLNSRKAYKFVMYMKKVRHG
jgi:glycosyltransferase involved in cell wall biosynthesis